MAYNVFGGTLSLPQSTTLIENMCIDDCLEDIYNKV